MHHHHLVESWSQLDQCVQSGQAIRDRSSFSDDEWRESFLMGMFNMAMNMAPMLIPKIDISSRRHLLDLGGRSRHLCDSFLPPQSAIKSHGF